MMPRNLAPMWTMGRLAALGSMLLTGCTSDTVIAPSGDPHVFFRDLVLAEHAVTLATVAPYDTIHLHVATALADGSPVPGVVSYTASDSTITVSDAGIVTAHFPTASPATVIASLTFQGQTESDTVRIHVADVVPPGLVDHLSIAPMPDSLPKTTVWGRDTIFDTYNAGTQPLVLAALGASGETLDIPLRVWSSDSFVATIDPTGLVTAIHPGKTILHVSAIAYGRALSDSLVFTVTWPLIKDVYARPPLGAIEDTSTVLHWSDDTVRIAPGGIVRWISCCAAPVDVIFADPTNVMPARVDPAFTDDFGQPLEPTSGPGNIAPFLFDRATWKTIPDLLERFVFSDTSGARARKFPVPGHYPYHASVQQATGVVIVCRDEDVVCP